VAELPLRSRGALVRRAITGTMRAWLGAASSVGQDLPMRLDSSDQPPSRALWFTMPMSRDAVLATMAAIQAGLGALERSMVGAAIGVLDQMDIWLREESTQRLPDEPQSS
jgi:hypothetical protein